MAFLPPDAPTELMKLRGRSVTEICDGFDLDPPVAALVSDALTPTAFLDTLIARGHLVPAASFLAHALPKREAVWWACQCAREGLGDPVDLRVAGALQAAENWVYRPTEENRLRAEASVKAVKKLDSGAAFAAMAASWSVVPQPYRAGEPPPPPPPLNFPTEMTGRAVTASVIYSVTALGRPNFFITLRRFLDGGIELAAGKPAKRS